MARMAWEDQRGEAFEVQQTVHKGLGLRGLALFAIRIVRSSDPQS